MYVRWLPKRDYVDGGALDPLKVYRSKEVRKQLTTKRGAKTIATGL